MPDRAALYLRVSTDEQRKTNLSIASQLSQCRDWARKQGYTLYDCGRYVDDLGQDAATGTPAYVEDASMRLGASKKTPALLELIAAAKAGAFDVMVALDVTRVSRGDPNLLGAFKMQLKDYKVRLEFASSTTGDRVTDQINESVRGIASFIENDTRSRKVREGKRGSAMNRQRHTGPPPFGYMTVHDKEHKDYAILQLDPERAPIAATIFESYLKGSSLRQIARELTAAGVLPPYSAKHGNTVWASQTVGRILKNSVYRGVYIFGSRQLIEGEVHPADREQWVEIPCPRIVKDAAWYAVQDRLATSAATVRNRPTTRTYALRGRIFCADCGRAYVGQFNGRAGRIEYRHRTRDGGCSHHAVPGAIEDKVFEAAMDVITSPEKAQLYYERAVAEHRKKFGHVDDMIASALKVRAKDVRALDKLTASYLDPDIGLSKPEFIRRRDELNRKIAAIDSQVASLESQRGAETMPPELESLQDFRLIDKAVAGKKPLTDQERKELARLLHVPVVSPETIEEARRGAWSSSSLRADIFAAVGVRVEAARGKRSRLFILGQSTTSLWRYGQLPAGLELPLAA